MDCWIIFFGNSFYIELSPLYSKLGVGLFNPKPDDCLCIFGDAVELLALELLHNYWSVSNFLFLLSGFLITGCNLFFILVNPYLARHEDVILVLDISDTLLSFFCNEGYFVIGDGVRLSSIMSMSSLFFSKEVITFKSELYFFLSESNYLTFCFLLVLPFAVILKPTSCSVLILLLSFDSLLLRIPFPSWPLLSYLFSWCYFSCSCDFF